MVVTLPPELALVVDLIRHIRTQFGTVPLRPLSLSIDGFALPQAQHLHSLVHDGDIILVKEAGAICPELQLEGSLSEAASPPAAKRLRKDGGNFTSTAECSPATREWVDALGAKICTESPQVGVEANQSRKADRVAGDAGSGGRYASLAAAKAAALEVAAAALAEQTVASTVTCTNRLKDTAGPSNNGGSLPTSQRAGSTTPAVSLAELHNSCAAKRKQVISSTPVTIEHPILGELEVPAGEDQDTFVSRKLRTLRKAVRKQVEHYFGDANWAKDAHLRTMADDDGYVPFTGMIDFERLRSLTTDVSCIRESVAGSTVVEVSPCGTKLRKPKPTLDS